MNWGIPKLGAPAVTHYSSSGARSDAQSRWLGLWVHRLGSWTQRVREAEMVQQRCISIGSVETAYAYQCQVLAGSALDEWLVVGLIHRLPYKPNHPSVCIGTVTICHTGIQVQADASGLYEISLNHCLQYQLRTLANPCKEPQVTWYMLYSLYRLRNRTLYPRHLVDRDIEMNVRNWVFENKRNVYTEEKPSFND